MSLSETTRVYRATQNSKAGIELSEGSVAVVGDSRHFVVVDDRGTSLKGPISIIADAMGIRKGGLFTGLNDFIHMIPSTIMTPVPSQIPMPPIQGIVGLAKDVAFFLSLLV